MEKALKQFQTECATEELNRIELVSTVIDALHAGGAKPVPSNVRNAYNADRSGRLPLNTHGVRLKNIKRRGWMENCMEFLEKALEILGATRRYLNEAYKLVEKEDYIDACEKIWAAVKHATTALTLALLGVSEPPKGISWREFVKNALIKAGVGNEEAEKWAAYFIDVRSRLHGECFYGLIYEEREHRPLMDKAGSYVGLVEEIIGRRTAKESLEGAA